MFHVRPMVDPLRLDEADLDLEGNCLRSGVYRLQVPDDVDLKEAIRLFLFLCDMSEPSNYRALIDTQPQAALTWGLKDLGAYQRLCPEPARHIHLQEQETPTYEEVTQWA